MKSILHYLLFFPVLNLHTFNLELKVVLNLHDCQSFLLLILTHSFWSIQEVETEQYYNFFLPELKEQGYDGFFSPKSRARTMSESDRKHVDGCAIFYKTEKYVFNSFVFFALWLVSLQHSIYKIATDFIACMLNTDLLLCSYS